MDDVPTRVPGLAGMNATRTSGVVLELAPGVSYAEGRLTDDVRGRSWPVNGPAATIIEALPASVGSLMATLRAQGVPDAVAQRHVRTFTQTLNARYLVNARQTAMQRVGFRVLQARALAAGQVVRVPFRHRRSSIDSSSYGRLLGSTLRSLLPVAVAMTGAAALVLIVLFALLGVRDVTFPVVLALAVGLGALLHETGHAFWLKGVPCAVTRRGLRPAVLHERVDGRRGVAVTAAGPAVGVLIGALVLVPAVLLRSDWLALFSIVSASQAAGFTCLSSDGRKLCAGP